MPVTDLLPAYSLPCKRCRQQIFINVTTLAFGGTRKYIFGSAPSETHRSKIIELDLKVQELRASRINAVPPGMNIQLIPDKIYCDSCKQEYVLGTYLKGQRLLDAGAFNCLQCYAEGFVLFETLEENKSKEAPDINITKQIKEGKVKEKYLMAIATERLIISGNTIVSLDRLSIAPELVTCLYCGRSWETKLHETELLR